MLCVSDLQYGVSLYRDGLLLDTYYFDNFVEARVFARSRSRASRVGTIVYDRFACDAYGFARELSCYYGGYSFPCETLCSPPQIPFERGVKNVCEYYS